MARGTKQPLSSIVLLQQVRTHDHSKVPHTPGPDTKTGCCVPSDCGICRDLLVSLCYDRSDVFHPLPFAQFHVIFLLTSLVDR